MKDMNEFNFVKGADASVRSQLIGWNDKLIEYLCDLFDSDIERVQGTSFGDSVAKISDLIEKAVTEPSSFRGGRDVQGRLQAGAIVEVYFNYLFVDNLASAPWNVLGSQPESTRGAGTSLMEELVKESIDLGFLGRLKLYPVERALSFYRGIGFVESEASPRELELTPLAARRFLERQRRRRRTGSN